MVGQDLLDARVGRLLAEAGEGHGAAAARQAGEHPHRVAVVVQLHPRNHALEAGPFADVLLDGGHERGGRQVFQNQGVLAFGDDATTDAAPRRGKEVHAVVSKCPFACTHGEKPEILCPASRGLEVEEV